MADGSDDHAMLLQISYDLARLQKQGSAAEGVVDKSLSNMEKRAKKAAQNLEEAFSLKGANFEGALGEVLQSSRLKVLDEGTAKIGLFGGALESLGPIGLGAAAGIGAFGLAVETNLKTAEWALELEHTAHALNETTTQVQQFNIVAASGGVDAGKLQEGIRGINQTIGNLESGLIRGKQLTEFVSKLGIGPEQLRSWGTLGEQLPHVLDAMAKLNPQERAGLAQRFHIDPETLDQLVELRGNLDAVTKSGQDFGIMSDADVEKQAGVAKQLKLTSAVIDGNFRKAMLDLSPVILGAQGLLERFSNGLSNLAYNAKLTGSAIAGMFGSMASFATGHGFTDPLAGARQIVADHNAPPAKEPAGPPPTRIISPTGHHRHGDGGAASALRRGDDDLDAADKLLADAEKALSTSFTERAGFELKALSAEQTKLDQKLAADLKTAKTQSQRDDITKAAGESDQAFGLKRQLVQNQLAQQLADQSNAMTELRLKGEADLLQATDELGGTTAQHAAAALKLFDLDEEIAEAKLQELIASKTASDAEKERARLELQNMQSSAGPRRQKVTNEGAVEASAQSASIREQALQAQLDQLDAEKGVFQTTEKRRALALQIFAIDEELQESKLREQIAEATIAGKTEDAARLKGQLGSLQSTAGLRQQSISDANPGNAWDAWAAEAKKATADVGNSLAQMQVDGVDKLNESLFDSEGRFNKLGTIARSVAQTMIKDAEQFGVKSLESAAAGAFGIGQNGAAGAGGKSASPLSSIASMFGIKLPGGLGGGTKPPVGTSADPIYTKSADSGSGGGSNPLSSLFGGSSGGGLGSIGSIFKSAFGGAGGGAGGGLSSILGSAGGSGGGFASLLASIPGFAGGGQFTVAGRGGVDRNLMAMKVSAGERVTIETPAQQRDRQAGGIGNVTQNFNFPGANPDGFRRSQRQWAKQSRMNMQYAGA